LSTPKAASLVPKPDGTQPEEVMHISSFVLVKKGPQILLLRRVKPERSAGWCLPGAVINYGEDPAQAALRIAREQLGTSPSVLRLVDVQSYGDKHWDLCFIFQVEISAVGKLREDFTESAHFEAGRWPPELREGHREVLDMLASRRLI
jgi:ADP-ribose pyrophosphatase YjhB (NUDIX family)